MVLGIFNIGPLEFLIMAAAAVMLFGGDLPQTARKAARMLGRLRALASELGREFSAADDLPTRKDIDLDLRRLADLDDRPRPERPKLPGRREDEPVGDAPATDVPDELPAWRRELRSELPDEADGGAADVPRSEEAPRDGGGSETGPDDAGSAAGGPTDDDEPSEQRRDRPTTD